MDLWCRRHRGLPYDAGGAGRREVASTQRLLQRLLAEPFFDQAPPKSTGRDLFGAAWLARPARGLRRVRSQDVHGHAGRTDRPRRHRGAAAALHRRPGSLLVCGGGAFNMHLMQRLAALLAGRAEVQKHRRRRRGAGSGRGLGVCLAGQRTSRAPARQPAHGDRRARPARPGRAVPGRLKQPWGTARGARRAPRKPVLRP